MPHIPLYVWQYTHSTPHSTPNFTLYRPCRCGKAYSRHRATIDPKRHACGVCHGKLAFLGKFDRAGVKVPDASATAVAVDGEGAAAAAVAGEGGAAAVAAGGAHAYRQFIKSNFASVKSSQPPGEGEEGGEGGRRRVDAAYHGERSGGVAPHYHPSMLPAAQAP